MAARARRRSARQVSQGRAGSDDFTPALTPVERVGDVLLKRDDLFRVAGVSGGKVRTCWRLSAGASGGLVTAGSRASPQANIVAQIARRLGLACRVHTPTGALSPELVDAQRAGAEVVQHRAGYNGVIVARAREDAAARGWREIPFGMECAEAVEETASQVENLPWGDFSRLVVPVGSGMSLAGVLAGLERAGRLGAFPVLAVRVGADPSRRLARWAPAGWAGAVELVASPLDYHRDAPECRLGDLLLDPVYEAKCLPFLRPGDLLWVVGVRRTAAGPPVEAAGSPPVPAAAVAAPPPRIRDLSVLLVDPRRLRPDPRNARVHSPAQVEALSRSMLAFGWTNPILLGPRGFVVVAGAGRLAAALALGLPAVPCVRLRSLSEVQRRAYILADNALAELASWEPGLLALELGALADLGFEAGLLGFSAPAVAAAAPAPSAAGFPVLPLSVFSAREGAWRSRRDAWLALGFRSELGRPGRGAGRARA